MRAKPRPRWFHLATRIRPAAASICLAPWLGGLGSEAAQQRRDGGLVAALAHEAVAALAQAADGVGGGDERVARDRAAGQRERGDGDAAALGEQRVAGGGAAGVELREALERGGVLRCRGSDGQVHRGGPMRGVSGRRAESQRTPLRPTGAAAKWWRMTEPGGFGRFT